MHYFLNRKYLLFGTIFWSFSIWSSTSFYPISVHDQISDADGVIIADYQGQNYKKDKEGNVVTVASFYVDQVVGISANTVLNRYDFKITYPGGVWQGVTYKNKGTPQFERGERAVLIVKKGKFDHTLPYLGLSKFAFEKRDDHLYLKSDYYPGKKGVGYISWSDFNEIIEKRFQNRIGSMFSDDRRVERKANYGARKKSRSPASIATEVVPAYRIGTYWLVTLLGMMGGFFSLMGKFRDEPDQDK